MTLVRRAYIVGSKCIAGQNPLAGVPIDKARIYDFLLSNTGGAWRRDEIAVLGKPTVYRQEAPIELMFDYIVYYFAGHGFTSGGRMYLCINDHQYVPADALRFPARKVLIVVDACRVSIDEPATELVKVGALAGIDEAAGPLTRLLCRRAFDEAIDRADPGVVAVFSCAYNESAIESATRGGRFTREFIHGAQASRPRRGTIGS